jgi:phage FluMu gp28-like protein
MNNIIDIFLQYQKQFFLNDKKRKIWIASRQIGKSFTIAGILCYKSLSKKNGLSLCISTGARASSEIIRKCG